MISSMSVREGGKVPIVAAGPHRMRNGRGCSVRRGLTRIMNAHDNVSVAGATTGRRITSDIQEVSARDAVFRMTRSRPAGRPAWTRIAGEVKVKRPAVVAGVNLPQRLRRVRRLARIA
jgi:hypothetical protein